MHWGSGLSVEGAVAEGPYHIPVMQLLEYIDGPAAGSVSLRFCAFSHDGRFERNPLIMDDVAIDGMRHAFRQTPRLRSPIARLIDQPGT